MPPPPYEQTIEAVTACGVPASSIRIFYQDELQSDVVTIGDLGGIDEDRLLCVRRAVHPFYIIEIDNEEQRRAFHAVTYRQDRQRLRAEATEWLQANGMQERVPRFEAEQGLESFARSLEAACGLSPGSALETYGEFSLTFRREFLQRSLIARGYERTACLMRMISASNAEEHDISLVMIGNEALNEDER
jgi:hypothetical protein